MNEIQRTKEGYGYTGEAFMPKDASIRFITYFSEEQVLSSLFMHRFAEELGHDVITQVFNILNPEHFSDYRNDKAIGMRAGLYKAMVESGKHIDPPNIMAWLADKGLLHNGTEDYIYMICSNNVTSLDAEHYAEVVKDLYDKRMGISLDGDRKVVEL